MPDLERARLLASDRARDSGPAKGPKNNRPPSPSGASFQEGEENASRARSSAASKEPASPGSQRKPLARPPGGADSKTVSAKPPVRAGHGNAAERHRDHLAQAAGSSSGTASGNIGARVDLMAKAVVENGWEYGRVRPAPRQLRERRGQRGSPSPARPAGSARGRARPAAMARSNPSANRGGRRRRSEAAPAYRPGRSDRRRAARQRLYPRRSRSPRSALDGEVLRSGSTRRGRGR